MAREYERWENNGYDTTTRSSGDNIERRSSKPKKFNGKYIFIGFSLPYIGLEVRHHHHNRRARRKTK